MCLILIKGIIISDTKDEYHGDDTRLQYLNLSLFFLPFSESSEGIKGMNSK